MILIIVKTYKQWVVEYLKYKDSSKLTNSWNNVCKE